MKKEEITAYHEAGHAIEYLTITEEWGDEQKLKRLTIAPDLNDEFSGLCETKPFYPVEIFANHRKNFMRALWQAKEEVKIMLSGLSAVFLCTTPENDPIAFIRPYLLEELKQDDINKAIAYCEEITGESFVDGGITYKLICYMFKEAVDDLEKNEDLLKELAQTLSKDKTIKLSEDSNITIVRIIETIIERCKKEKKIASLKKSGKISYYKAVEMPQIILGEIMGEQDESE